MCSSDLKPLLLDTRAEKEFAVSRIPAALHAPTVAAAERAITNAPRTAPVILYCSVGYRSSSMAAELQKRGFTNVFNLEGSLFQWSNEGRAVETTNASALRVHPYDKKWGRFLRRDRHPDKY